MACKGVQWYAKACNGMQRHVMVCYGVLWCAMACKGVQWYAISRKYLTANDLRKSSHPKSLIYNKLQRLARRKSLIVNGLRGPHARLFTICAFRICNAIVQQVSRIFLGDSLDSRPFMPYLYNMITITRNRNFPQWLNIVLNGKLVDNALTHAKAMSIANQIQKVQPVKTNIVTR